MAGDTDFPQFLPFRLEKDQGLFLNLRHGFALCYSGWKLIPDQSLDFTSHVPDTGARVILVCLSPSGSVHLVDGIVRTSRATLTVFDVPPVPEHEIPVGCVLLAAGQTEITMEPDRTDVGDFRSILLPPVGGYGEGGSSSGGSTTLAGLQDVSVTSVVDGQALCWNDSDSLWEPATIAEYTGPKITVSASAPGSPSAGDIWIDIS